MEKKKISQIRRKNAKLYSIYKMFSWDLLFFYSIEFLFYTTTKKITASEVLIVSGIFMVFKIITQIPAVAIIEYLGKRKSLILGNSMMILYILSLVFIPGVASIVIANLIYAIAFNIKDLAGPNLLYDSTATRGGSGLYTKLEAKGGSWYYLIDGVASLTAGYLFVIDNYLPIYICLAFIIISTILSFGFQDVYQPQKKKIHILKQYGTDMKQSFKFILHSKRIRALILFGAIFYGIIEMMDTYRADLLVDIGIPAEYFSMIFAVLTFIRGISVSFQEQIEKRFKNRTLTVISLVYIVSAIIVGVLASAYTGSLVIAIILMMYAIQKMFSAIWYILESKYVRNYTIPETRNKISFIYEFIAGITGSTIVILGGILLDYIPAANAILITSLISLAVMTLTLDYMRTRFGLKPEQYKKEDIEF